MVFALRDYYGFLVGFICVYIFTGFLFSRLSRLSRLSRNLDEPFFM